MGDSILILTPLLVLAVVLLLAFAGCSFEHGVLSSTLTFRARVPTDLTVVGGVTFTWRRPTATMDQTTTLTSITSGPSVQKYIDAALNLGPPAFLWTLGNVDGLQDRTGKGRDGTAAGGVTLGGVQDGPTEFFDATATQFDGADDRITSPHDPVFMGAVGRTFVGFARRH